MVYANNIHTKGMLCYLASSFSGLEQCKSYDWQLRPRNGIQKCFTCQVIDFWGFCSIILDVAHTVEPLPDNWTCATVSKQKFDYSFLYLLETLLCTKIPFRSLQRDSARHFNINSAWKLLVARCVYVYVCMCVCGWSLNTCFQHIHLQR